MPDGSSQPLQTMEASRENQKANSGPLQHENEPSVQNNYPKARTPPRISPPPLKRQRIGYSSFSDREGNPRPQPALKSTSDLGESGLLSGPKLSSTSKLQVPLANHLTGSRHPREDDERSHSSSSISIRSNSTAPLCRSCRKSITKGYDPQVLCPSCHRPYHESCRKPLPGAEDQPDLERCFKCVPGRRKSRMQMNHPLLSEAIYSSTKSHINRPSISLSTAISFSNTSAEKLPPLPARPMSDVNPKMPEQSKGHQISATGKSHAQYQLSLPSSRRRDASASTAFFEEDEIQDNVLDKLIVPISQFHSKPQGPKRPVESFAAAGRTEIPETPDQLQGSSQIPTTRATSESTQRNVTTSPSPHNRDSNARHFIPPTLMPGQKRPTASLCCICRVQPVRYLGGKGDKLLKCQNCKAKEKKEVLQDVDTTIPETPESTLPNQSSTDPSPHITRPSSSASLTNDAASKHLWIPSTLTVSKRLKIRTKALPANALSTYKEPQEEIQSPSPTQNHRRPEIGAQATANVPTVDEVIANETDASLPVAKHPVAEPSVVDPPIVERPANDEMPNDSEIGDNPIASYEHTEDTHEASESDGPASTNTRPTEYTPSLEMSALQPPANDGLDLASQGLEPHTQSFYVKRDLIGMALIAANGERWSTAQVNNWIADNFFLYRKGEGNWEKSVSTTLSKCSDFHGAQVPGQRARLWTFQSTSSRMKFEKEFAQHPALAPKSISQNSTARLARKTVAQPVCGLQSQSEKGIQAASADAPPSTTASRGERILEQQNLELVSANTVSNVEPHREISGIYMPFERPEDYLALHKKEANPNISREIDFFKAFPQYAKPSIETMSKAEIQAKIENIKERPSRKAGFGNKILRPGVRPRRDPHDEMEGKWHPTFGIRSQGGVPTRREDVDDTVTMKETFGFPDNPVPVLFEGQLAFRDGTPVSGKLPRLRGAYKVGRLFGGELRL
ncbi:hypothetical protein CC80DRAFT_285017 [Byssothecium circinans]|uniref:Fork-head domain-containing protein n=1 Tax=Byssothecium circinans TaxID=147558 RepID=A0A6A5U4M9_9PLEO|nr:hypothetical protein CC80DRAFT_285017 [Byssothecium circinans]